MRTWRSVVVVTFLGGSLAYGAVPTSGNLLLNPGAELGSGVQDGSTVANWIKGGESNPGRDDGTFDAIPPHSGNFDFYGGTGASGTLTQNVDLTKAGFTTTQLDTGGLFANVQFFEQSYDQGDPSDAAGVTIAFRNGSSGVIGTTTIPPIYSIGSWREQTRSIPLPSGTRSIDYTMDFLRNSGSDLDSFIDDNSLTFGAAMLCGGPGDANMDGKVNFADLLILAQNYGKTSGQTCATGDFNSDGGVTFPDLLILAQNYGQGGAPGAAPVPEPSALCVVAPLALLARRRRKT